MKNAVVASIPLSEGIAKRDAKAQKKQDKEAFKSKKFQNLSDTEKDDLLKVVAIQLGIIEE